MDERWSNWQTGGGVYQLEHSTRGQETTITSMMIKLLHHGCFGWFALLFKEQMTMEEMTGDSPYRVSIIAGNGSSCEHMPSANELQIAKDLGKHLTTIAKRLAS